MTSQLYKKADRADEVADLDLRDADMYQIAQAVYDSWFPDTEEKEPEWTFFDTHRNRAVRMLAPFRESIRGDFDAAKMKFKRSSCREHMENASVGIFLSALLEGTTIGRMLIKYHKDYTPIEVGDLGGRTVEMPPESKVGSMSFSNGTVINRGNVNDVYAARRARGPATFINYGSAHILNAYERGDLVVNFGEAFSLGYECGDGIFLNFGELGHHADEETSMGYCCTGGVYVAKVKPRGQCMVRAENTHYIGPEQLKKRKELSRLMDAIEEAGKDCDIPKIKEYGRKVDEEVRRKYVKRRVA